MHVSMYLCISMCVYGNQTHAVQNTLFVGKGKKNNASSSLTNLA